MKHIDDITDFRFTVVDYMNYETFDDFDDYGTIYLYRGMDKLQRLAVGIHAMIELILGHFYGITSEQITKWDTAKGKKYDPKMYDRDARYKKAHKLAEKVERMIVEESGLTWKEYEKALEEIKIKYVK